MPSQFGPIVSADQVEKAALRTAQTFLPSYLAEVAAQHGMARDALAPIRSWTASAVGVKWPEHALPGFVLISTGLFDTGEVRRGKYTVPWAVGAYIVVSGATQADTARFLRLYLAAIRACFLQNQSLPYLDENNQRVKGMAEGIEWIDESYDDGPIDASRTLASGQVNLAITVKDVLDVNAGISIPTVEPAPSVTVEQTFVEVRKAP